VSFIDGLIGTESGGNWAAQNSAMGAGGMAGHFGRLQFGQARLQDAIRAGIIPPGTTPQQFMADPAMQQRVEQWHFADIDAQAKKRGLLNYVGQEVGGVPITNDAIRAMAHLGGIGGAEKYLTSGGQYNPADDNGTSLRDYARIHGGGGDSALQGGLRVIPGREPDKMQPKGLLDRILPQEGGQSAFWNKLGPLADPDKRMMLAIALEGMTTNPNQAFIGAMQGQMKDRRADERLNKTVEYLRTQPGGEQYAAAIEAGIDPGSAWGAYLESQKAPPQPTSDDIREYQYAQSQGYQGTFQDFMIEMKRAGATSVNVGANGMPGIGTVPQGYAVVQDPSNPSGYRMEAIPGGPEDTAQADQTRQGMADTATQTILNAADRARTAAQERMIGGLPGQFIGQISPGSQNAEAYRQVGVLKSIATIESLNAMRQSSPTGGALGNVTQQENVMLAQKAGALDPASPNFERDLADYTRTLLQIVHGPQAGDQIFQQSWGESQGVPQQGEQKRLRYNPQTGGFE
jgi:hypothetical protein